MMGYVAEPPPVKVYCTLTEPESPWVAQSTPDLSLLTLMNDGLLWPSLTGVTVVRTWMAPLKGPLVGPFHLSPAFAPLPGVVNWPCGVAAQATAASASAARATPASVTSFFILVTSSGPGGLGRTPGWRSLAAAFRSSD